MSRMKGRSSRSSVVGRFLGWEGYCGVWGRRDHSSVGSPRLAKVEAVEKGRGVRYDLYAPASFFFLSRVPAQFMVSFLTH